MISYFHVKYFHDAITALPFPGTEFIYTGCDDFQYWREFGYRWNGINDLTVVEQDIVVTPDVISGFEGCKNQWCVYPYGSLTESLGCTRFRKELQRTIDISVIPGALVLLRGEHVGPLKIVCEYCNEYSVCWRHLDLKVSSVLKQSGYTACVHSPSVRHLH